MTFFALSVIRNKLCFGQLFVEMKRKLMELLNFVTSHHMDSKIVFRSVGLVAVSETVHVDTLLL